MAARERDTLVRPRLVPVGYREQRAASPVGWRTEAATLVDWARHAAVRRRRPAFDLGGETYPYLQARYGITWRTERIVELPVAARFVEGVPAEDVLEVGNVLRRYFHARHRVVDKYERARWVENADVVDLAPCDPVERIVTISTLEHAGFDEDERDPDKPWRAIEHLRRQLSPTGRLLVTLPVGYNPHVDERLRAGAGDAQVLAMRRTSRRNDWREVSPGEALGARYGEPFEFANAVVFLTYGPAG